jgi:cytidylate kinase
MNTNISLAVAGSYLNSQWHGSRNPWDSKAGPFVTISREAGCGGASLAKLIARALNAEISGQGFWHIYEANLTLKMLRANQLPNRIARFLPEDRVSEIQSTIGEMIGLHPSLWDLVEKTKETMCRLARDGHAILVGRGANFATAGLPHGVHVRLVAPASHRAKYLAQLYGISEDAAYRHNARCDAARRRYVSANFNTDVADPKAYDLVINTAKLPLPEAAELVAAHVRARTPAPV